MSEEKVSKEKVKLKEIKELLKCNIIGIEARIDFVKSEERGDEIYYLGVIRDNLKIMMEEI